MFRPFILCILCFFLILASASAFADSLNQNSMTETQEGDVNTHGGDVNTEGGDVSGVDELSGDAGADVKITDSVDMDGNNLNNAQTLNSQAVQTTNIWTDTVDTDTAKAKQVTSDSVATDTLGSASGSGVKISDNMDAQSHNMTNVNQVVVKDVSPDTAYTLASKWYVDTAINSKKLYGNLHSWEYCLKYGRIEGSGGNMFCVLSSCWGSWRPYRGYTIRICDTGDNINCYSQQVGFFCY